MLWVLLTVIVLLVASGTILGFLGRWNWLFDLFSHFRVQYLILLSTIGLILLLDKRTSTAYLAFAFGLINLYIIAPLYIRGKRNQKIGKQYRFLLANVLQPNKSYRKVIDLIQTAAPDFILLIEINHSWDRSLMEIQSSYPYKHILLREDHYGLAIFSRHPYLDAEVRTIGSKPVPTLIVKVELDGENLTIIGTHPPPPKGGKSANFRNIQLRELATFIRSQEGETILCGDLNITRWSPIFQDFLKLSNLRDSSTGFGYQPTWPTHLPFFLIPIDHCLMSKGISIIGRKTGPRIGSDHFPLLIEFSIQNKRSQNAHSRSGI